MAQRPALADAFLAGRVVFPGDELAANVDVALWRVYDRPTRVQSGSSVEVDRSTGSFHHGPVAPGTYRLTAMRTDELLGTVEGIVVGAGETVVPPDLVVQ